MRDYKKLEVWQKSHKLYIFIKKEILINFPEIEKYDLSLQISRSALSVPLNIAEGSGRYTNKDFAHFLNNSLGSLNEVDNACYAGKDLGYISEINYNYIDKQINEIRAKIITLIKYIRNQTP